MPRQSISVLTDTLTFGKYAHTGKTIKEIIDTDPEYLLWLYEEGAIELHQDILDLAYESDANNSPPEEFYWTPDH
jgi:uncharacterized protein (DUF3820 family)